MFQTSGFDCRIQAWGLGLRGFHSFRPDFPLTIRIGLPAALRMHMYIHVHAYL